MKIIAGIDIGNATTEVALAKIKDCRSKEFIASAIVPTSGIKGTKQNLKGVLDSLDKALAEAGLTRQDIDRIRINEAAPVIGDVAMETITETIITESTMIGHNPETPGGCGIGVGITESFSTLEQVSHQEPVIVLIAKDVDFVEAAVTINGAVERGIAVMGAILQNDEGVLIHNRLKHKIPIVDEVTLLEKVPLGVKAAIEVAAAGSVVEVLSNPYGIATLFKLNSEETKLVVPISRALIGNRSAVVVKTPKGDVQERKIPVGKLFIRSSRGEKTVDVEDGASQIMEVIGAAPIIEDIKGEAGTNAGGMLQRVRQVMSTLTQQPMENIKIQDLLAVDTFIPQKIKGGLAQEFSLENAVGIAAMVKADKLQMQMIAERIEEKIGVKVEVGGVEAEMAISGALTTPGSNIPLAVLDMGAGSTDASIINQRGEMISVHLAGAGNMVTMLIQAELGLESFELAEDVKKYPLAKVESLFHIRHEDGTVEFFEKPLEPQHFARVVILKDNVMLPIPGKHAIESIKRIRRDAKKKVFVTNGLRALSNVAPMGNIRSIEFVVLVGGSALDFEIPQMVTDALSKYGVVAGRGNIRGTQGPRNAVATGLVLSYTEGEKSDEKAS